MVFASRVPRLLRRLPTDQRRAPPALRTSRPLMIPSPTRNELPISCRVAITLVVPLALAALLSGGCRQILNVEERDYLAASGDGGSGGGEASTGGGTAGLLGEGGSAIGKCGGYSYDSGSCAACMDEQCCSEVDGCKDAPPSTGCTQAATCLLGCRADDAACRSRCKVYYTLSAELAGVIACRANHCAEACGSLCGGLEYDAPACDGCVGQSC